MLNRYSLPLALLALLATSAHAQVDYVTVASAADLMDGVLSDVEIDCMDRDNATGIFYWYDEATDDLVAHNPAASPGSRTTIVRTNAQLDADRGADVTDCRSIAVADGFLYAALANGSADFVYKTDVAGTTASILSDADGISGIDVLGTTVVLAMVEFFGAPEDGFYTLATTGTGQTPTAVTLNPAFDLYDVTIISPTADLPSVGGALIVGTSSEFGGTGFKNVLVVADGATGTVILDPFADGTFTNPDDGGLEDLEFTLFGAGEAYMFNNSFGAADGEQWAFTNDGITIERFAEQSPMLADPDVTIAEYSPSDGTHMVIAPGGNLYVASCSAFGGEDAIIGMLNVPVPVELTSFTATTSGTAVHLHWETASETNNAGFEVQIDRGTGFEAVAFVDGHGTTTEAQTYGHTVTDLAPGTYAFRLKQIDFDGAFEYSGEVEATIEVVGTHVLTDAYPNPFNPQATFTFAASQAQTVTATLYNALGQRVAVLFDGSVEADQTQTVSIDGAGLSSGLYVVRVEGERFSDALRVTLLK